MSEPAAPPAPPALGGRAAVTVLLCLAACAAAPFLGPSVGDDQAAFVLWQLRVPRLLVAMLVGATLAIVGGSFQIVFANPLASESTVGTISGAALGALIAIVSGATMTPSGLPIVVVGAFAGALAVTLALTSLAARGRIHTTDILLAGIALSLAASAVSSMLQTMAASTATFAAAQWSLGQLTQVGYRGVLLLVPFTTLVLAVLLARRRALEALVAGEERAHSQGVDVRGLRALTLGVGALGVGACVAWCGPISFVGLIVPHVVRLLFRAHPRYLLPLSAIVGAAFLAVCDTAARLAFPGRDVPVGAITALLGAPALIALVVRQRAS